MTQPSAIERAVAHLADGGVVAAATESFFGLLADVTQHRALEAVFSLKPRGADKGVPLLLPRADSWPNLVTEIPPLAALLADEFWPGPLSIALPARVEIDSRIALGGTVAVRLPAESPAAAIARLFGIPLTASSANRPGEPPATEASAVVQSFAEAVASGLLMVVSGSSPGGAPSTVVVVEDSTFRVVREAAIPEARLQAVVSRFSRA